MNHITATTAPLNGASTAKELFALTDEQILEIEPQPEEAGEEAKNQSLKADSSTAPAEIAGFAGDNKQNNSSASAEVPVLIAEAKALKEIYPLGVEEARSAAERARALDEFDVAYFGASGKSAEEISAARTALAQQMLQEDPAAFQEMVAAGVRALAEANKEGSSVASTRDAAEGNKKDGLKSAPTELSPNLNAVNEAQVRAYGEFEKTANAELEKSVGGAIERALHQALPHAGRSDSDGLKTRLAAGVRQEIEKALQGDRQLGEQVAQILSARRFDDASRAQVVRLIGERAGQLVPGATKRVLQDWTQTTLAAHRSRADRQEGANARVDLAPAQQGREIPRLQAGKSGQTSAPFDSAQGRRNDNAGGRGGRIDYKKLSDEQILDL